MKVKTCSAMIKAAGANEGTEEGVFEAIVASYNVDSIGDRIIPGAFKKSLDAWKARGNPIPVLWAHKSDDPDYHIGHVLEAEERPEGLWVKAQLDIDDPGSKSAKIYRLLKGRRVTQFSFAYDEVDARPAEKSDDGAKKDLHELALHEIGPCLIGMNRQTSLLDVKSASQGQRPSSATIDVTIGDRKYVGTVDAKGHLAIGDPIAEPAPAQACESCGESDHIECFDQKTAHPTVFDVIEGIKASGVLSKEHVPVLETMLADLAAGMGALADVLDVLVGPEADEKAKPAQPADVPAPEAKDVEPARPGTAS
ncbi:MAG: HK97 family phage prohead protease, partial [Actinomycetota bacterium]|nr:HK97 family phage prohead protease [Actinomycetota bacterium]